MSGFQRFRKCSRNTYFKEQLSVIYSVRLHFGHDSPFIVSKKTVKIITASRFYQNHFEKKNIIILFTQSEVLKCQCSDYYFGDQIYKFCIQTFSKYSFTFLLKKFLFCFYK